MKRAEHDLVPRQADANPVAVRPPGNTALLKVNCTKCSEIVVELRWTFARGHRAKARMIIDPFTCKKPGRIELVNAEPTVVSALHLPSVVANVVRINTMYLVHAEAVWRVAEEAALELVV